MCVCAHVRVCVCAGACHVESLEWACSFRLAESVYSVTSDLCSFLAFWGWFLLPFPTMASLAASHADAHAELGQARTARVRCVSAARPSATAAVPPLSTFPSALTILLWLSCCTATGLRASGVCKSRSAWAITAAARQRQAQTLGAGDGARRERESGSPQAQSKVCHLE